MSGTEQSDLGFPFGLPHPNQIKQWKDQLLDDVYSVFDVGLKADNEPGIDVNSLHAKIAQLTLENDFLAGVLNNAGLLPGASRS